LSPVVLVFDSPAPAPAVVIPKSILKTPGQPSAMKKGVVIDTGSRDQTTEKTPSPRSARTGLGTTTSDSDQFFTPPSMTSDPGRGYDPAASQMSQSISPILTPAVRIPSNPASPIQDLKDKEAGNENIQAGILPTPPPPPSLEGTEEIAEVISQPQVEPVASPPAPLLVEPAGSPAKLPTASPSLILKTPELTKSSEKSPHSELPGRHSSAFTPLTSRMGTPESTHLRDTQTQVSRTLSFSDDSVALNEQDSTGGQSASKLNKTDVQTQVSRTLSFTDDSINQTGNDLPTTRPEHPARPAPAFAGTGPWIQLPSNMQPRQDFRAGISATPPIQHHADFPPVSRVRSEGSAKETTQEFNTQLQTML
jgi:hypothetical protein